MLSENQRLVNTVIVGVATTGILTSCVSPEIADTVADGIKKSIKYVINKIPGVQPTNFMTNSNPVAVLNEAKDAFGTVL